MPVKSARRRSARKASRSAKRRSSRSRKSYRFARKSVRKSVKRSTKARKSTRKSVRRSTKARRSYRFGSSRSCRSQSSHRGQILAYYDGAAASYGTIPNCFYKIGSKSLKGGKYSKVDTFAGPDKVVVGDAFWHKKEKAMTHIRGALRRSGKRSFHVQST